MTGSAQIKPSHLVIVYDALAEDKFMSKIYTALVPIWLKTEIPPCSSAVKYIKAIDTEENRIFILTKSPYAYVKYGFFSKLADCRVVMQTTKIGSQVILTK